VKILQVDDFRAFVAVHSEIRIENKIGLNVVESEELPAVALII